MRKEGATMSRNWLDRVWMVVGMAAMLMAGESQHCWALEADAGWDNGTNGFVTGTAFKDALEAFDGIDLIKDPEDQGLGPVYNAQACRECHQNSGPTVKFVETHNKVAPASGSGSQVLEHRAGFLLNIGGFLLFQNPEVKLPNDPPIQNRNLINDRAICPNAQERVPETAPAFPSLFHRVETDRLSLSIRGDGFIEAIPDAAILAGRNAQCGSFPTMCGTAIFVPILEAQVSNAVRIGRFGWKNQHASLLSFAADAYLNEMGITNDLQPDEVTMACIDGLLPPNDEASDTETEDIEAFAQFMRSTKVPPQFPNPFTNEGMPNPPVENGRHHFKGLGCVICHTETFHTAPVGTTFFTPDPPDPANPPDPQSNAVKEQREFKLNNALGNKDIHPYSDFLLHDIGTGDVFPLNPDAQVAALGEVMIAACEHYHIGVAKRLFREDLRKSLDLKGKELDAKLKEQLEATSPKDICNMVSIPGLKKLRLEGNGKPLFENAICSSLNLLKLEAGPKSTNPNELNLKQVQESHFSFLDLHCTTKKLRTPPLWGIHMRSRLMHDGRSFTYRDAILRHQVEAAGVTAQFTMLTNVQQEELFQFLDSLGMRKDP